MICVAGRQQALQQLEAHRPRSGMLVAAALFGCFVYSNYLAVDSSTILPKKLTFDVLFPLFHVTFLNFAK